MRRLIAASMMSEPLGEVGANIFFNFHREHSNKKVIAQNQCEKHIKLEFSRFVDFSQVRQGRLFHVRAVVAATCIKIKSQVAQRNEDLIACRYVSSNHLKRKAAYTGREVEMFYL